MPLKTGDKIVAHTRLAVEIDDVIALFTPGEIITAGVDVPVAIAQAWLARGSAGLFVPTPAAAPAA